MTFGTSLGAIRIDRTGELPRPERRRSHKQDPASSRLPSPVPTNQYDRG